MAEGAIGDTWDLVVSSLAIHHLEDADKRRLFRSVISSLASGGLFVNVEQVRGPDEWTERLYRKV